MWLARSTVLSKDRLSASVFFAVLEAWATESIPTLSSDQHMETSVRQPHLWLVSNGVASGGL